MSKDTLVVFTRETLPAILAEGGTQAWVINAENARRCKYVVLCANQADNKSDPNVPHGTAFLLGCITAIDPAPADDRRWIIRFDRYANINVANVWAGSRNPVRYQNLSDLGIDTAALLFLNMPSTGRTEAGEIVNPTRDPIF